MKKFLFPILFTLIMSSCSKDESLTINTANDNSTLNTIPSDMVGTWSSYRIDSNYSTACMCWIQSTFYDSLKIENDATCYWYFTNNTPYTGEAAPPQFWVNYCSGWATGAIHLPTATTVSMSLDSVISDCTVGFTHFTTDTVAYSVTTSDSFHLGNYHFARVL